MSWRTVTAPSTPRSAGAVGSPLGTVLGGMTGNAAAMGTPRSTSGTPLLGLSKTRCTATTLETTQAPPTSAGGMDTSVAAASPSPEDKPASTVWLRSSLRTGAHQKVQPHVPASHVTAPAHTVAVGTAAAAGSKAALSPQSPLSQAAPAPTEEDHAFFASVPLYRGIDSRLPATESFDAAIRLIVRHVVSATERFVAAYPPPQTTTQQGRNTRAARERTVGRLR